MVKLEDHGLFQPKRHTLSLYRRRDRIIYHDQKQILKLSDTLRLSRMLH